METIKLTPAQQELYNILDTGCTLVYLKASSTTHSWFAVESESGEQKSVNQRTGKGLISSGLLTESERKVISEHRVKIYYKTTN